MAQVRTMARSERQETSNANLRILVGSDLHNSQSGLDWFIHLAQVHAPGVVCFLGDFINVTPLSFMRDALMDLRGLAEQVYVLPGNWDPREGLIEMDHASFDGLKHLHKQAAFSGGYIFVGLGGSTTTPLGTTPIESPDEGFANPLVPLLPADIWVLHNPIWGYRDQAGGVSVGSRSLRALWEEQEQKPLLVFNGHIHEAYGSETAEGTTFVNPGSLKELRAALVELDERAVNVELLTEN